MTKINRTGSTIVKPSGIVLPTTLETQLETIRANFEERLAALEANQ